MTASGKIAAPHIVSSEALPKMTGLFILSLLPLAIIACLTFGWPAARLFGTAVISVMTTEFLAAASSRRKVCFPDGTSFLTAILIAAMLPVQLPLPWAAAGCVASVLIGKEIFGGFAALPFHPAMVGIGFLTAVCPGFFATKGLSFSFAGTRFLSGLLDTLPASFSALINTQEAGLLVNTSLAAIWIGAMILLAGNLVRWEGPCAYLVTLVVVKGGSLFGGWGLLQPIDWFVAFYVITDFVTTPTTRPAQILFAVLAALFQMLFNSSAGDLPAIVYSVLIANAFVPWMDEWVRPRRSRFAHPWAEMSAGLRWHKKTGGR